MSFEDGQLQNMVAVGLTTPHSVRLWLRSSRPGPHRLELWPVHDPSRRRTHDFETSADPLLDGTASVQYPEDAPGAPRLAACTRYGYRVTQADGTPVGEGGFETAPEGASDAPERFAFAVMSCHQPFDPDGEVNERSLAALQALRAMLATHDVKRVLLVGDQMYSDYPTNLSLFDDDYFPRVAPPGRASIFECTRGEVRKLYHERYRIFWKDPFLRGIQADYPCYPMCDDHEIRDNFGSSPEHSSAKWHAVRDGALDAYQDYQGLRMDGLRAPRPESFHFTFEYGPVAGFVMDIRSQRRADEDRVQIYADSQAEDLQRWLDANATRPVLLLVTPVPIVHVPDFLTDAGAWITGDESDFSDRWSHHRAVADRDRLLKIIHDHQARHPAQKLALLAGDIHTGAVVRLVWRDGVPPTYQLASSAVSNSEMPLLRRLAKLVPMLTRCIEGQTEDVFARCELLPDESGENANPYGGLNIGIVECERAKHGEWTVRLALVSHDADAPENACVVFRSPPL